MLFLSTAIHSLITEQLESFKLSEIPNQSTKYEYTFIINVLMSIKLNMHFDIQSGLNLPLY